MLSNLKFIIQQRAKRWVATACASAGLKLTSDRRWRGLLVQRDRLFSRLLELQQSGAPGNSTCGIIFSKDRPLQVDGLLNSYAYHVENAPPLIVLFKASTSEYEGAYQSLAETHKGSGVRFVREQRFRPDLIALLKSLAEERVFFLTDDDIFVRHTNFADFMDVDLRQFLPSLRLGLNLSYCYNAHKPMPPPPVSPRGKEHLTWKWNEGTLDWAYAGSVDGHIFLTVEMLLIAEISDYSAPNTFEEAMQTFSTIFNTRAGICYTKSRLVNVPANKVQAEYNSVSAAGDPAHLLKKFQDGYRLDWRKFIELSNRGVHEDIELPLLRA
jgi:hypothetical protein